MANFKKLLMFSLLASRNFIPALLVWRWMKRNEREADEEDYERVSFGDDNPVARRWRSEAERWENDAVDNRGERFDVMKIIYVVLLVVVVAFGAFYYIPNRLANSHQETEEKQVRYVPYDGSMKRPEIIRDGSARPGKSSSRHDDEDWMVDLENVGDDDEALMEVSPANEAVKPQDGGLAVERSKPQTASGNVAKPAVSSDAPRKSERELSTLELLERQSHARAVEEAKRVGVSTEGSTSDILSRISHAHVVEEAKRVGVSTEGSTSDILSRITRKHFEK